MEKQLEQLLRLKKISDMCFDFIDIRDKEQTDNLEHDIEVITKDYKDAGVVGITYGAYVVCVASDFKQVRFYKQGELILEYDDDIRMYEDYARYIYSGLLAQDLETAGADVEMIESIDDMDEFLVAKIGQLKDNMVTERFKQALTPKLE